MGFYHGILKTQFQPHPESNFFLINNCDILNNKDDKNINYSNEIHCFRRAGSTGKMRVFCLRKLRNPKASFSFIFPVYCEVVVEVSIDIKLKWPNYIGISE